MALTPQLPWIGDDGATTPETSSTPSSMHSVTLWRFLCTVIFLSFFSRSLPKSPSHIMIGLSATYASMQEHCLPASSRDH